MAKAKAMLRPPGTEQEEDASSTALSSTYERAPTHSMHNSAGKRMHMHVLTELVAPANPDQISILVLSNLLAHLRAAVQTCLYTMAQAYSKRVVAIRGHSMHIQCPSVTGSGNMQSRFTFAPQVCGTRRFVRAYSPAQLEQPDSPGFTAGCAHVHKPTATHTRHRCLQ